MKHRRLLHDSLQSDMFICGNDETAKAVVAGLTKEIGFETYRVCSRSKLEGYSAGGTPSG